ncbi:hypothetical protein ONS95_002498 [Cadophora gregata]|uniref:uncharacterized protein n=1 Tax=Cadophora gregata TaxID=51156 RepID=UPI0026DC23D2|nr:uncharacterized protein ONS95_002498 [Cadophora gregata]KAK0109827.1 hypothetical protein ONS95_002498 [Cadophora gregata]
MVNTGKPSRGCYMCRARRIKCDEGKPGCMRCQKSKRVCPGYRDAFELKLRDESKATKKKLNRRAQNHQNLAVSSDRSGDGFVEPSPSFPTSTTMGTHSRNSSMSSVVSRGHGYTTDVAHRHHSFTAGHMTTPLSQQASCYFLANFVLVPEAGTMRGYLDFVIPLLKQRTPPQSLVFAFSAVALAALGTRPNSKALLPTADLWYLKALKEINLALQNPKTASTDSTLASVMLMASFEQLTPSRMKVGGWSSHIDGAVAVMKSRTMEQWRTPVGKELFIAVRAHMTVHCIANSKPINPGVDWMGVIADDPIVQTFAAANLKMAQLRADNDATTTIRFRSAENIEKVLKLLQRAEALDKQYIDWIQSLPPAWQINTVAFIDGEVPDLPNSVIHPGRVDAYGEMWMAYKYNIVRGCRLFIYTTILRCVAWLGDNSDYRLTPEYATATQICRGLIEDIVASVPYFFGWNRGKNPSMADRSNFACGEHDPTRVKPLAGIFSMWPIFAAASSDFASPSQRIFLRGRLKHIADMMGINQALIMFQAQLVHPSLYIARERMSWDIHPCQKEDAKSPVVGGASVAATTSQQSPTVPLPPAAAPTAQISPTSETQLWRQAAFNLPQPAPVPQTQTWVPSPPSELLWSPPPPAAHLAPAVSAAQDRTWSTSPPLDQSWKMAPESAVSTSGWIPRTFTEPFHLQDSRSARRGPTFSFQSPPEYERDHHTFEHAGFGAVSSV